MNVQSKTRRASLDTGRTILNESGQEEHRHAQRRCNTKYEENGVWAFDDEIGTEVDSRRVNGGLCGESHFVRRPVHNEHRTKMGVKKFLF